MKPDRTADRRRQLLRLAGTVLATGLLLYLLSRQGWQEILDSLRRISIGQLLLVFLLTMLSRLAVFGRWAALLRSTDVKLSMAEILRITFAGLFAANFLPTSIGGDIVRLANSLRIREQRYLYATSIVVDRLIGALGMAMLLPIGIAQVMQADLDGLRIPASWLGMPLPLAVAGGGGPLGALWAKVKKTWRETWDAIRLWAKEPQALGLALLFTWFHMLLKFTSMWIMFRVLGEAMGFWQVAGLWSFVYFITLFPVSINGLGLQEVSTGFAYSSIAGAAMTNALTVALLVRVLEMAASLPGALFLPALIGPSDDLNLAESPDKSA